jgi:chloramphenicol-sensitive protein RarD
MLLSPVAAGALFYWRAIGTLDFGAKGPAIDVLLLISGVATAVPLMCFGEAARRLRLSTLGFLQYLAPTIQFLLAIVYFKERFTPAHVICFGCTWAALLLVSLDSFRKSRASRYQTPILQSQAAGLVE